MVIQIELPPDLEKALGDRARESGLDLSSYVVSMIRAQIDEGRSLDDLIDHEGIAWCARQIEGQEIPTLEEVREALSTIPDSMAQAVIEERHERY